jgi:hypothetical protein
LRVKTQLLKRIQCVLVIDGATHSQREGVEGNGGSLKDVAEAFVLSLHITQLALRFSVRAVLYLDEVDIVLKYAETFGSVLSGEGGSADCVLAVLLRCS